MEENPIRTVNKLCRARNIFTHPHLGAIDESDYFVLNSILSPLIDCWSIIPQKDVIGIHDNDDRRVCALDLKSLYKPTGFRHQPLITTTTLVEVPEEIGKLTSLEELSFRFSSIVSLPLVLLHSSTLVLIISTI